MTNDYNTLQQIAKCLDGIPISDLTQAEKRIFHILCDCSIMYTGFDYSKPSGVQFQGRIGRASILVQGN